jgi:hypothetical protein
MAKSRKKHGANELSLALGISVAILVIGVVVFLLSPKVCTGGQGCDKITDMKQCKAESCVPKHKLFSALMSDVNKGDYNLLGTAQRKTGVCCDKKSGNACQGFSKGQGKAGCGGTATPGCVWKSRAVACIPPIPQPQPQPQPQPSGQNCLCGAGTDDWQGKQCGGRGAADGDDWCTSIFEDDKICGNVGEPDGCVMTSRKPHTSNDAPDVRSCTDELRMTNSQCMQGDLDQLSDQCKMAMRACGGSGPDPGPGEMGPGCYGKDRWGVLEYLGKSCSDASECGQTFTDCRQVEGFRARRRRRCM